MTSTTAHSHPHAFRRLALSLGTLSAAALLMGGCPTNNSSDGSGDGTEVNEVSIRNFAFQPKEITIHVGERIRWTNDESLPIPHTITSGDPDTGDAGQLWDSGTLSAGQSFTHQFDEAGEFEYFCRIHADMAAMRHAQVIVEP